MLRSLRRLAPIAALALAAACVTPSVPIPPPEPERMSFSVDGEGGTARFEYLPSPSYGGAVVYVFNRDRGTGIITTAADDGSVGPTEPFPAAGGEQIVVTFELADSLAATCVVLQDGPSSSALECDL